MIQIDLITGFLGAGKTTFLRHYANYFIKQGLQIGILENDFGAVNVDAMLLQDILSEQCDLEMVAGGCDKDCHRRRFKTKLIAMAMCGYDRVIVEPSGIFDMDEFFDVLHEDPLDRFYNIGSVITIIDANIEKNLSDASRYILSSQVAQAGTIIYSHMEHITPLELDATQKYVSECLESLNCKHQKELLSKQVILQKSFQDFTDTDFQAILSSGYQIADYRKLWFDDQDAYQSLYFMNRPFTEDFLKETSKKIFQDVSCGKVFRIKGFLLQDKTWLSVNITREKSEFIPTLEGQEILIVIGESLQKERIEEYFGKSN